MKKLKKVIDLIILSVVLVFTCISCHKNDDSAYFNGDIMRISNSQIHECDVKLKEVLLNGANYGWIAVYDSLIFFMNPKLSDSFYNVFNVNTGEELGIFCGKGGGPDEVAALGPIFQFFKEGDDLKTLLFAPNEERLLIWNISQSLKQGKTIMDRTIPYTWRTENQGACYHEMFLQDKDILFTKVSAFPIGNDDATLPVWQKRTVNTNKCLSTYSIYKQTIRNDKSSIIPEAFYYSNDAFKPDGTKIVQVMTHFPQLNIIDVQTGRVVGYRMDDNVDFTIFEGQGDIKGYFGEVKVDDNYIYASYWGEISWGNISTIYVFNWEGEVVCKINTDHAVNRLWIDSIRNRLYAIDPTTDDVFYCDLDTILKDIKD